MSWFLNILEVIEFFCSIIMNRNLMLFDAFQSSEIILLIDGQMIPFGQREPLQVGSKAF